MKIARAVLFVTIAVFATAPVCVVSAQSNDPELPTPVLTNEISGNIRALDLGDSRLTRHFYAFETTPGDLIVTVNSRNLNGDVDIFTAMTFRPLTKISIYAGTIPPEVTKSIYSRTRQILILRVEARTPNDDVGAYRITFGGSFQPFTGGIPVAENRPEEAEIERAREGQRLSSVGATLPKPPAEVAVEEVKPTDPVVEKPAEATPVTPRRNTSRRTPRRATRNPPRIASTPPPKPEAPKTETPTEEPKTEEPKTEEPKVAAEPKPEEKPISPEKPAQETPPGARLVLELTDGTRVDRPMSTVRRVIVESNMIVITLKSGRTQRIPMSTVTRMAIEP